MQVVYGKWNFTQACLLDKSRGMEASVVTRGRESARLSFSHKVKVWKRCVHVHQRYVRMFGSMFD